MGRLCGVPVVRGGRADRRGQNGDSASSWRRRRTRRRAGLGHGRLHSGGFGVSDRRGLDLMAGHEEKSPLRRPGFIAAAVFLALVVVLALAMVISKGSGGSAPGPG